MFYSDSTIVFSTLKGFGESYFILCPVCWNSSIKVTCYEDGTTEEKECGVCRRMLESMDSRDDSAQTF
jgi:hypothetical protein